MLADAFRKQWMPLQGGTVKDMTPVSIQRSKLFNPVLSALRALGGSGSVEEIDDKVIELERLPEEVISQLHDPDRSAQTEVAYQLAWVRTYLKNYGLLENSSRGVWALTAKGHDTKLVDPKEVEKFLQSRKKPKAGAEVNAPVDPQELLSGGLEGGDGGWRERLHQILTQKISPGGFERLIQRLLRESGFTQVEVTGRTGDEGIDGKGIARINGLMSFHVFFQCKRYKGTVGAGDVRDFRGAMVGRGDKGLFITTGTFSPSAVKEATRDGAPPIDLVDGIELSEKLKSMGLGVSVVTREEVTVNESWFDQLV